MAEQTTFIIIQTLFVLLIGIIGYLLKDKIKSMEKKIENLEIEMDGMKKNYLDRFENVKEHITEKFDKMIEAINEIKLNCAKVNHLE